MPTCLYTFKDLYTLKKKALEKWKFQKQVTSKEDELFAHMYLFL